MLKSNFICALVKEYNDCVTLLYTFFCWRDDGLAFSTFPNYPTLMSAIIYILCARPFWLRTGYEIIFLRDVGTQLPIIRRIFERGSEKLLFTQRTVGGIH